jgi:hypothetical protein
MMAVRAKFRHCREVIKLKIYHCASGKDYELPEKCCAFCKHCTDIFWDYTNGPYMFLCELTPPAGTATFGDIRVDCKDFIEEGD